MGATTNMWRKENRNKCHTFQEDQGTQVYWSTHGRKFWLPAELPPPGKHQNKMCLSGLVVHHLSYETLQKYVTGGCPVKTGRNWTKEEIYLAVMMGPHDSVFAEEAIAHFTDQAK